MSDAAEVAATGSQDGVDKEIEERAPTKSHRTARDLAHWSIFGRSGRRQPQTVRATKHAFENKTKEFASPITVPWSVKVSASDSLRLLHGFVPAGMEDKWFIYSDGPVASCDPPGQAHAAVHFHRSWTGDKVASIALALTYSGTWQARVQSLTYEAADQDHDGDGDEALEHATFYVLEACRWVLHVLLGKAEDIREPRSWSNLVDQPLQDQASSSHRKDMPETLYKSVDVSDETDALIRRLGFSKPFVLT